MHGSDHCYVHNIGQEEHRRMSIKGGRRSWERRLAINESSPLAPLMAVLNTTIAELMTPGIGADEVRRLRALTYTCSVACRVVELSEYGDIAAELTARLADIRGSDGRLLAWPAGGEYGS